MKTTNSLLIAIEEAYMAGNSVLWIARDLGVSVDMVARVVNKLELRDPDNS